MARLQRRPRSSTSTIRWRRRGKRLGEITYEDFLAAGDPDFAPLPRRMGRDRLNYTSGTTGNPKGVVYHHRGAYLNALGNVVGRGMPRHPVYLWTLPMFHCNGWCFTWAVTAVGRDPCCLRRSTPPRLRRHRRARA